MIDTHAHITCDELYPHAHALLARAKDAGVSRILCICLNLAEVERAFVLKQAYPWLDIAAGFHPSDLYDVTHADWERMAELIQDERILAIGEIGLDYHWDEVDRETQKQAFIKQLTWANQYHKPVIIHMRDATKDTLDILREYKQGSGIMHCFSGSLEVAKQLLAMDLYLSVGGPLTFRNARGLPEVIAQCPVERLFIETDSPYLTPHPHRGKRNEPMYLRYTSERLAELKQMSSASLNQHLRENYRRLFGICALG
ncbi:MAG: TatD family hydrolase [Erysipelotrichaceae bacterium]|nr:TatD family hydrolase [Erysipelotrichaceae bacterium]